MLVTHSVARKKTKPQKPTFISAMALTLEVKDSLRNLSREASDFTGWTVSGSALVRALVVYADKQGASWLESQIFPLVEKEQNAGIVWGKLTEAVPGSKRKEN